ncbi:MAG: stage II sporulation protein P, partial [bacterium]|nr:stage II sporulation protein P [bacterium]
SRINDESKNIVAVGQIIADCITQAGYKVIHDKTVHDYPAYSGSYTRSAQTVKGYLSKYPSIKIIIDLHRDAIASGETDKVAPVTEINGKKAAQVMLVMGSGTGSVEGHEKWQENLKLAVRLQRQLQSQHPSLARAMLLKSNRYNQDLSTGALLIEIGTDANTLEQAKYSGEMVGASICELFKSLN